MAGDGDQLLGIMIWPGMVTTTTSVDYIVSVSYSTPSRRARFRLLDEQNKLVCFTVLSDQEDKDIQFELPSLNFH